MMIVKENSKIKLDYVGKLDDGTIFESTKKSGVPLVFEVVPDKLIPGFYNALLGMKVGEIKEFRVEPEEAYGLRNDELTEKIPRNLFPPDPVPEPGMMFYGETEEGTKIPSIVIDVSDDFVMVDFNHPMAGNALNFSVEIKEIIT